MATDERLARLGLLHLKDKPQELDAELARRAAAYQADVDAWHKTRAAAASEPHHSSEQEPSTPATHTPARATVKPLGKPSSNKPAIPGLGTQPIPNLNKSGRVSEAAAAAAADVANRAGGGVKGALPAALPNKHAGLTTQKLPGMSTQKIPGLTTQSGRAPAGLHLVPSGPKKS